MRKFFYIFSILIFSCTQNNEKPKNLISEEKMVSVLSEIYLHQQVSYTNEPVGKPFDYARLNASLLKQQGVTVDDFEESYKYYVLNPDLYEPILVKVRAELESRLPEEERLKRENLRKEAEKNTKK